MEKKEYDYQIIRSDSEAEVIRLVKAFQEKGWETRGGIAMTPSQGDETGLYIFAQAMVMI